MRFLFAPDSFKGTLSSEDVISILTEAARSVFPDCEVESVPMADGGEGTLDILLRQPGSQRMETPAQGPMGEERVGRYCLLRDGRAVIEMAQINGLPLLPAECRDPLRASTYGTGQLIRSALNSGCRDITVTVGGSATNDGGVGCMAALGVCFLDGDGRELAPLAENLEKIAFVDKSGLLPALKQARLTVMSDVENPLLGPNGATCVFGPQKGVGPALLERLETGMQNYAELLQAVCGRWLGDTPGAGAAGGLGAALMAFCGAEIRSGIASMLELVEFEKKLEGTDLVVTGEGHCDGQSACGKVLSGVGAACQAKNIPAVALVGGMSADALAVCRCGIQALIPAINDAMPLETALAHADALARAAAERLFALLALGVAIHQKEERK